MGLAVTGTDTELTTSVWQILKYVDVTSPDMDIFRGRHWKDAGPPPLGLTVAEESAGVTIMQEQIAQMEECVKEKTTNNL